MTSRVPIVNIKYSKIKFIQIGICVFPNDTNIEDFSHSELLACNIPNLTMKKWCEFCNYDVDFSTINVENDTVKIDNSNKNTVLFYYRYIALYGQAFLFSLQLYSLIKSKWLLVDVVYDQCSVITIVAPSNNIRFISNVWDIYKLKQQYDEKKESNLITDKISDDMATISLRILAIQGKLKADGTDDEIYQKFEEIQNSKPSYENFTCNACKISEKKCSGPFCKS